MFGLFRFFLASLVALSHFGLFPKTVGAGGYAVISFYMLSGLLMHRQYERFSKGGSARLTFYVDRVLRIFPVYWIVCLLTLLAVGGEDLLHNLTLLPLSYQDFTGAKPLTFPAWSLATEFHFYLLLPILYEMRSSVLRVVMWVSFFVFASSPLLPHSTWWGYYGMPGMLFVFVAGLLMARKESLRSLVLATVAVMVVFIAGKLLKFPIPSGINITVCIGVIIGVVAIPYLDGIKQSYWDTKIGSMTLPLFLCHPLVIAFTDYTSTIDLYIGSLVLAVLLTLFIEIPFDTLRYFVRKKLQALSSQRVFV